ncbi:oxysterol-binding protein [Sarocladium implicatum]|nr:oxysterol-binding protein [Sarocladium implicatum]
MLRRNVRSQATRQLLLQVSSTPVSPNPEPASLNLPKHAKRRSKGVNQEEKSLHDHCESLLADLDSVVSEFTGLINASKRRRIPAPRSAGGASRKSIETTASSVDEFFDAEDANSRVVQIDGSDDESAASDEEEGSFPDNSSVSSFGEDDTVTADDIATLYPTKPKNLTPLPIETAVTRRTAIPPSAGPPPSLIALVRKNVGKDLSTISMPVSTNEPTSMLQKVAEQMEYSQLLDSAVQQTTPVDRLLYVTAFAVSQFSSSRAKERAVRKPFTPLLGETFELVRTNKEMPGGFRLLVEKVQHRPIKLAMQADSANWSFSQCASPGQKFWGKSAEITTDGRVRVALRLPDGSDELYSWNIATMFLRNVVMGEKYVEPVGSMHVFNDSTGLKATAEFKSKGMFGARVEEVQVDTFNPDGSSAGGNLIGNWMNSLKMGSNPKSPGEEIWRAGPLADNAAQAYGLTAFAAGLNEVTPIEKGKMAPTDCRLRPDQRMAEEGNLDGAEEWKTKLEEAQRARRRELEESGEEYRPRWFVKVSGSGGEGGAEGEDVWKIKGGKESYWEERAKGNWEGTLNLFDV